MANFEFLEALGQIARDQNIDEGELLMALANALLAAYKRRPDSAEDAEVEINPETGEIKVWGLELDLEGNVVREWDATPDDFGRLGDRPSHPELFDWLARDFMRQGWSTKTLVRQLVLSQAFRESGVVDPEASQRDPYNRLRHHYGTRRLEAEQIRDSLLAVSGRLDRTLYGRPILPPRTVEDDKKRLFSGPVDGNGRRSLYLMMSIMAPPKFLTSFDLPDLKLPSGRRNVTSVPTQALLLLNDPLVAELSHHWARELIKAPHRSPEERIDAMFVAALGRQPGDSERARWASLFRELSTTSDPMTDEGAWSQLAHTLFNTKEFIHYR